MLAVRCTSGSYSTLNDQYSNRAERSREASVLCLEDRLSEDSTKSSIESEGTNFPLQKRNISDDEALRT